MIHSLIIGGTKGIGRSLVRILAGDGHTLSIIARGTPAAYEKSVDNVKYWHADLLKKAELSAVLKDIISENGKLNHLICLQRYRGLGDNWAGEIETTLTGTKYLIENLVEEFKNSGDRSIVLANSIAAHLVVDNQPLSYHIAKAGIDQMIRYYAVALGPRGIRVNGVSPGTILKEESRDYYLKNDTLHALHKKTIPLRRMGTAEEVSNVIAFLCGPCSSFVTGQTIIVDGGLSLQWQETLVLNLVSKKKS